MSFPRTIKKYPSPNLSNIYKHTIGKLNDFQLEDVFKHYDSAQYSERMNLVGLQRVKPFINVGIGESVLNQHYTGTLPPDLFIQSSYLHFTINIKCSADGTTVEDLKFPIRRFVFKWSGTKISEVSSDLYNLIYYYANTDDKYKKFLNPGLLGVSHTFTTSGDTYSIEYKIPLIYFKELLINKDIDVSGFTSGRIITLDLDFYSNISEFMNITAGSIESVTFASSIDYSAIVRQYSKLDTQKILARIKSSLPVLNYSLINLQDKKLTTDASGNYLNFSISYSASMPNTSMVGLFFWIEPVNTSNNFTGIVDWDFTVMRNMVDDKEAAHYYSKDELKFLLNNESFLDEGRQPVNLMFYSINSNYTMFTDLSKVVPVTLQPNHNYSLLFDEINGLAANTDYAFKSRLLILESFTYN